MTLDSEESMARSMSAWLNFRFSGPKATSSSTVSVQNWVSGSCWTMQATPATSLGSVWIVPSSLISPEISAGIISGMNPQTACIAVDLPEALSPARRTNSPRPMLRVRFETAGLDLPRYLMLRFSMSSIYLTSMATTPSTQ